eukprot:SAG31_NODE_1931_length_6880_cov_6.530010_1_plen_203_part_10
MKDRTQAITNVLAAHHVPAGASSFKRLADGAKTALQRLHVQCVASEEKENLRKLLQMGFELLPSCAALDECTGEHKLELAVLRLTDGAVLSPPARFRVAVTDVLRSGAYVPPAAAAAAKKKLKDRTQAITNVLAAHHVPAGASSFKRLADGAKTALQRLHVQCVASEEKENLRKLLQMGFELLPSCAALGECTGEHKLELAVL